MTARSRRPRVEVVIDELVLRGIDHPDAHQVQAALQAELAWRAAAAGPLDGLPARAEASRRLPAVSAPAGAPAALGATIAGAVWSNVGTGGPA